MMSPCETFRLRLTEYAAGDLAPAEADAVARHLGGCPGCRRELELERELRATLGSLPLAACPPDVGDFVPAGRPTRRARRRWPWAAGLAAAAVLAAVLLGGLPGRLAPRSGPSAWTEAELATARHDVIYTLDLTADVLERSQRAAVLEAFGQRLPQAVTGSLKLKSPQQGDEG